MINMDTLRATFDIANVALTMIEKANSQIRLIQDTEGSEDAVRFLTSERDRWERELKKATTGNNQLTNLLISMSCKQYGITSNEKLTLLSLSFFCRHNNIGSVSQSTLVEKTGTSPATVKRSVNSLKTKGWIRVTRQPYPTPNSYDLNGVLVKAKSH